MPKRLTRLPHPPSELPEKFSNSQEPNVSSRRKIENRIRRSGEFVHVAI
jgi:hypothetical protein